MSGDFSDLDQKAFGWFFRAIRSLTTPARPNAEAAVSLDQIAPRLTLLACAIAERAVRLESTDEVGGVDGTTIRVPARIDTFADRESNSLLYVERTILDATAVGLGVRRPDRLVLGGEGGDLAGEIASLALVPMLATAVTSELPAFASLHASVTAALLGIRRPLDANASPRACATEAFVRAVLGDPNAEPTMAAQVAAIGREGSSVALELATDLAMQILALASRRRETVALAGALSGRLLAARMSPSGTEPSNQQGHSLPSGTERKARRPDALRLVELPRPRDGENPLEHSFEKVHTVDRHQGGQKQIDGEDELGDHGDALDDAEIREVIRTREAARSVYQLEGTPAFEAAQLPDLEPSTGAVFYYDEWSGAAYESKHCRLVVDVPNVPDHPARRVDSVEGAVRRKQVRKVFEALEHARRPRPRMPTGDEVDVDAMIDRYGFVRAGEEGSDRLYIERPTVEPDVATMILLDLSSSSDAWIDGRRVLDVARDAIATLGDVLDEMRVPFAVSGFFSQTRRDCHSVTIKAFGERWSASAPRLLAVEPTGYTRIGPALRHATADLLRTTARRKALLVVTDGRPTDFDRYEGRYGITDVKKACDEASTHGVGVFALAIAKSREPHLSAMFGSAGFEILPHPAQLAERLARAEAFFRR